MSFKKQRENILKNIIEMENEHAIAIATMNIFDDLLKEAADIMKNLIEIIPDFVVRPNEHYKNDSDVEASILMKLMINNPKNQAKEFLKKVNHD